MSNVPHAKLRLSKRSLKLSGQTYAVQQKKLERVLAEQLEDLELKEQAIGADRTREQVLADFISHQELVIGLLEQQQGWLAALSDNKAAEQQPEQEQLGAATAEANCSSHVLPGAAQKGIPGASLSEAARGRGLQLLGGPLVPPVAAAAAAASPVGLSEPAGQQQQQQPDTSGTMSYVAGLLANATPAQLRRVMDMKAEDWQQYKHDHFMRLVALLELVNRPSCLQDFEDDMPNEQQQQQGQQQKAAAAAGSRPASGSSGASGNTTTAAPAGELLQDPAVPAAAAAAAATATSAAAHGSGLDAFDIFRRFQDAVDEGITLSFLALFFNHLSITQASTNADLPQQAAPAGLWLRVVRKLNLTEQQLLQLRLASEELTRLNRSCSQEAETLMGRANGPSLLLAAEASIQAAATASASGGSGSSASASGGCGVLCNSNTPSAGVPASGSGADSSGRDSSAAAAGAAATDAAADEDAAAEAASEEDEEGDGQLDDLLQRHLRLRFLYMVMIGMFVFNTMTRVQIAQMTVGCYPFYPMLTAVTEAAATLHKQQQEETIKRIRAKRRQRVQDMDNEEQDPRTEKDNKDKDDGSSSSYARQQLQQHQEQRNRLLVLQQAFWQQQLQHGMVLMQP